MNMRIMWLAIFLVGVSVMAAQAAGFDGSKPFVCAIVEASECGEAVDCRRVGVQEIDCPRFFRVDLSKKIVTGILADQTTREVEVQSSAHVDGNLILQGVQGGRAWSLVVSEATGKMTLTVAGAGDGFVLFGESFFP